MHKNLLNMLNQIVQLDDNEVEMITAAFTPLKLEKGDFFLRSGEINRYVGYLDSGLVRYFVYKDGEESTFEFTKEGEFVADYQSFNNRSESVQNIQAIEDCQMLVIGYDHVQNIFRSTSNGNLLGRVIVEHRFDLMVNQLLAIYMQSHMERYENFVTQYADLTQRIPQYMIASYVGVQPPSLSRIRKRFAESTS